MARPRTFDPDAALDAAERVFHERGYEAASVQDLVDATGLSRSSLYAAWGDKHGLFLAVLDRYAEAGQRRTAGLCDDVPPLDAVRALLELWARPAPDARGCLLVNAAAERAGCDPDTAARAERARLAVTARLAELVQRAQRQGQLDATRSPDALACFLAGVLYGLRGMQTAGAGASDLATVINETMRALEPAG